MKSFSSLRRTRYPRRSIPIYVCGCFLSLLVFFIILGGWPSIDINEPLQGHPGRNTNHLNLRSMSVPVEEATIFVSIAAYRDSECVTTLESLFGAAKNPKRVFIGISEERFAEDVSCIDAPHLIDGHELTRSRTMSWSDIVPLAFSETYGIGSQTMPLPTVKTPLLHEGRDKDIITCLLSSNALDGPNPAGKSPLDGCQVITRVGAPADARGPTYGRYLTSLLYNNQDYYMIIDSHSRLLAQWDLAMITTARLMPTRGVMSHYPNGYTPERPDFELAKKDIMLMCRGVILKNNMPKLGAKWIPIQPKPILQGFVGAGFIFGDAQFAKDVPFDPYLSYLFDGEEILYTVRLWTSGWDAYSPGRAFLFHNYDRKKAPRYFVNIQGKSVAALDLAEKRALYIMERENVHTTVRTVSEEESSKHPEIGHAKVHYGLGKKRSIREYWRFVQLSNEFILEKDNENRWKGGDRLCKENHTS